MLKMQLEIAEKELGKLREVELTMFRMLKTAEDTSAQMTQQAKTAAEHYIEDARQKGEELVNEARKKSNMLIIDAENQVKYVREEIIGEFKGHERDFKAMEKYRDNLVVQLKTLANNTVDSIERFEKKFSQNAVKEKFEDLKTQITDSLKADSEIKKARIEAENLVEGIVGDEPIAAEADTEEQVVASSDSATETEETSEIPSAETEAETAYENENPSENEKEDKKAPEEGSFFDQI
jgi:cell division initiation protein